MNSTTMILWRLLMAVVGLFFCGLGGHWLWTILSFWRRAKRASGIVTELRSSGRASYPVVQFTTHDGRDVETTTRTTVQPMPARPGDETTVLYDHTDPTVVELTVWHRLSFGLIFLIMGLVPVLVSVLEQWQSNLSGWLFIAGLFGGIGLLPTLFGATTLVVALRVKRIGYTILGGLLLGFGLFILGVFGFVLFAFVG